MSEEDLNKYGKMSDYEIMELGDYNLCKRWFDDDDWKGEYASIHGYLPLLKKSLADYCGSSMLCLFSLQNGRFDCFKYLYENGHQFDKSESYWCITNLECCKYVLQHVIPTHDKTDLFNCHSICNDIIKYGKQECFEYLDQNGYLFFSNILLYTIQFNNLKLFKYLYDAEYELKEEHVELIIVKEYKEFLEHIIDSNRHIIYTDQLESIIKKDDVNFLRFCYEKGVNIQELMFYCIQYNSLKCFIFLFEKEVEITDTNEVDIIRFNRLEFMGYLFENSYDFNENACNIAVSQNKIECLRYLYNYGFSLFDNSSQIASQNGSFECLKFIMNNCDIPDNELDVIKKELTNLSNDKIIIDWNNFLLRKFLFFVYELFNNDRKFKLSYFAKQIKEKMKEIYLYTKYTTLEYHPFICSDIINYIISDYF